MSNKTEHCTGRGAYLLGREFAFVGEDLVEFVSTGITGVYGNGTAGSDVRGTDEHFG